jgi:hypothetical protein
MNRLLKDLSVSLYYRSEIFYYSHEYCKIPMVLNLFIIQISCNIQVLKFGRLNF